ncbi:hypothetical protein HRbin08_01584 [bacterium HR08]|nr:hypothetical protein HRbin08_01584 [bacterium HR08]
MSFLSPWFLLGALALLVPVLVHLRRREPQPRIPFASVLFLRRLPEPIHRRRRMRYWLLFLLRSGALLLLVLAFARPYWRGGGAGELSGTALVVLLDCSFSMRYGGRFARAQEKAEEILARAPEGARVGVIGFSTIAEVRAPLGRDREAARAAVRALRPTFRATDYARGVQAALALLENAAEGEKIIYLISDFHRSGRQAGESGWAPTGSPRDPEIAWGARHVIFGSRGEPVASPSRGPRVVPISVASEVGENHAIVDVRVLSRVAPSERSKETSWRYPGRLLVRVGNFRSARARTKIRLSVNDRLVQEQAIELDPDAVATVEFTDFPLDPGSNRIRLEADPDRLPEDDRFFLVLRRELPKPVLILDGTRTRAPGALGSRGDLGSERASFYIQQALLADEAFGPERIVVGTPWGPRVRTLAGAGEAPQGDLVDAEAVVLVDPTALDERWAAALRRFVTEGGGMILALDPQTEARAFNAAFGSWLGVRMEEGGAPLKEPVWLTEMATEHPIFRPFADPRRANFSRVQFWGYAGLALDATEGSARAPSSAALVLARFSDGRPAIVEITRGRGKVILLAFGLDARWSTLPLTPLYAPLIHQLLAAVRRASPPPFFRVGESIAVDGEDASWAPDATFGSRGDPGSSVIVRAPDGERLRFGEEPVGGARRFIPEQVGFYRLRRLSGEEPIAVNVEAGESDVRALEGGELDQFLASLGGRESGSNDAALSAGGERAADVGVVAAERSRAWRALLLAAILLLLSEAILAERASGRRRSIGVPVGGSLGASLREEGRGS